MTDVLKCWGCCNLIVFLCGKLLKKSSIAFKYIVSHVAILHCLACSVVSALHNWAWLKTGNFLCLQNCIKVASHWVFGRRGTLGFLRTEWRAGYTLLVVMSLVCLTLLPHIMYANVLLPPSVPFWSPPSTLTFTTFPLSTRWERERESHLSIRGQLIPLIRSQDFPHRYCQHSTQPHFPRRTNPFPLLSQFFILSRFLYPNSLMAVAHKNWSTTQYVSPSLVLKRSPFSHSFLFPVLLVFFFALNFCPFHSYSYIFFFFFSPI